VAKRVGINTSDDFYNTLGFGGITLQRFIPKIKEEFDKLYAEEAPETTKEDELSMIKLSTSGKKKSSGGVVIDGESGCQIKFARCCNPLPGDKIVGFITRGFGVSVHKSDCPNVHHSRQNEDNLARWVRAEWEKEESGTQSAIYEATLQIIAEDGIGVIAGISMVLADMKVSITQINTQAGKDGEVFINIVIQCKSVSHYNSIVSRLKNVPKVLSVVRGFSH